MTDECKGDYTSAIHQTAIGTDGVIRCIYCGLIQYLPKRDTDAT